MKSDAKEEEELRQLTLTQPQLQYCSNEIKSTSSNVLTFVPLNLLHQLSNMANIYFLIISIFQMIPSISVTNGTPTTLFPLMAVMLAVLIKDAYEQFYRYLKDKGQNERQVQIFDGVRFTFGSWQSLRVGDIIKIRKEDFIPCDSLVVKTSDPQNRCFVQTKGLDGETNLKLKQSYLSNTTTNKIVIGEDSYRKQYRVECSGPNPYFSKFEGTVQTENLKIPLDASNLILRGCILKNVHEVIAACIYTGSDTKVVLNSVKFQPKKSKLMQEVNKLVIEIFIWQLIIAMVCSLFNTILQNSYLQFTQHIPKANFWITMMSWWLLMTYFIPISLMVTMQMVKLFQGAVLDRDRRGWSDLYQCFTMANNTSVNENLGQIKFVFTDKTGTLTKNNMLFRNIICGGELYGGEEQAQDDEEVAPLAPLAQELRGSVNFRDSRMTQERISPKLQEALRLISICHDIYVEKEGDKLIYNSSSPDEMALISFARLYGRELLGERNKFIEVAQGTGNRRQIVKYEKLAYLQFNSVRKRMSVIVRNPVSKKVEIYTKGADSTVKELIRAGQKDLEITQKHIDTLSVTGLRTLMLGKRTIPDEEYRKWNEEFVRARGLTGENREKAIFDCYEKIEKNLQLVGATAIEDELQDDVMSTIRDMRLAGMSFFILTGDKRETAINIGRACGLIDRSAQLVDIPMFDQMESHEWRAQMLRIKEIKNEKVYLLNAEKVIPPDLPLHQTICYRCTPSNKEKIVRHVKEHSPYLTLAVGDGANDVNMITAADVGVGIKGKQGTQAARVADFVAGQFKFIRFLTLYYGREWYRKNARLVTYSFYKNWFHVSSVVAFGAFSYFSGVAIFNVYLYELFNVLYSSWPIIIYGVFDEEYTKQESNQYPDLYAPGIRNDAFNQSVFLREIGFAIFNGVVSLLTLFYLIESEVLTVEGKTGYLVLCGASLFAVIVIIINIKILVMSTGVRPLGLFVVLGSIAIYWGSYAVYAKLMKPDEMITLGETWQCPTVIFTQIVLIFFLIFIEFGYRKYQEFSYLFERAKETKNTVERVGNFILQKRNSKK